MRGSETMRAEVMLKGLALLVALALLLTAARARAQEAAPAPRSTPTIEEVQRAALRYHGLAGDLDRWSRRARAANLLPRVEVGTSWQTQRDTKLQLREDQLLDEGQAWRLDQVRNEADTGRRRRDEYGVRARFELGGLIFDDRELSAQRVTRQLVDQRREVLLEVTERYYDRRQLLLELEQLPPDEVGRIARARLELERREAELDALTGGWFSRHAGPEVHR